MKGAIQVSVGFLIIMVVSALVLIFIMGWLGQIFPTLTRIGDYATTSAENEMMKKFSEGSDAVATTIPTKVDFSPGTEIEFIVGIKKTTGMDEYNYFALCIATGQSDRCTSPSISATDSTSKSVAASGDNSGIMFLFAPNKKIETRGSVGRVTILMQIPHDTAAGFYNYRFFGCGVSSPRGTCTRVEDSFGDTDFIVRIK